MSESRPPFRATPRDPSADELRELRRSGGFPPRLLRPESALAALESGRLVSTERSLLLRHPSERVFAAALEREAVFLSAEGAHRLLARALEEAERRGEIWNPRLDALSRHEMWRERQTAQGEDQSLPSQLERLQGLLPWLSRATEEETESLAAFRSSVLHRVVARNLPAPGPRLLKVMLGNPECWAALARNPSLPDPSRLRLLHALPGAGDPYGSTSRRFALQGILEEWPGHSRSRPELWLPTLASIAPQAALEVMEANPGLLGRRLPPELWARLLASPHSEHRLRAIRLQGTLPVAEHESLRPARRPG